MGRKNGGIRKGKAIAGGELNKFIAEFLESAAKEFSEYDQIKPQAEPMVYGFNLSIGSNGRPILETFGNIDPKRKVQQQSSASTSHERLVDVIDGGDKVTIIAELPGILKEDLVIKASRSELIIESNVQGRKYRKTVLMPKVVDPDTANAQLNNGVLEVTFNKPNSSNNLQG